MRSLVRGATGRTLSPGLLVQLKRNKPITSAAATTVSMVKQLPGPAEVTSFIQGLNQQYEKVHKSFEDNFWSTKMGLKDASSDALAKTKDAYEGFLGSPDNLKAVRQQLQRADLSADQRKVLAIMERTFKTYITEDQTAIELKEKLNQLEAKLAENRNKMNLGYTDPVSGEYKRASSVQLRTQLKANDNEAVRKAAYEGMRSIGPYVSAEFAEIVKVRNKLAKLLGFQDFYDYKVTAAEGFGKDRLFEIMDGLEQRTRDILHQTRKNLATAKGEAALEPYNISYATAGDTTKATDPYFPFEDAVDVWGRTFAALGINYQGSIMNLDLCDRQGKYSNGFCHWPQPAWRHSDGDWVPAQANFTSLATPNEVGSGFTALVTLLHEGGHAAHFANIDQYSPFFSQERAPTSVAYAENQSMFLDSLAHDAAWLGRYARSREGEPIPWNVIEQMKTNEQTEAVLQLRAMLAVPYFEKALYELPEDKVTPQRIQELADTVEKHIQGGLSPRPLLSVPHILADESACYYHGYVLAEMSVHQTRDYFKAQYGAIVDNPKVGEALTNVYWRPGNGAMFLDLVQQLTGAPLSADAWVARLNTPLADCLTREKQEYEEAVKAGPKYPPGAGFDMGMHVRLVDGDDIIADSEQDGGLEQACAKFKSWVRNKYFNDNGMPE
eukprot:jgi/Chrzof1/1789/Cz10g21060.t1